MSILLCTQIDKTLQPLVSIYQWRRNKMLNGLVNSHLTHPRTYFMELEVRPLPKMFKLF
jgi:hypothetical protein